MKTWIILLGLLAILTVGVLTFGLVGVSYYNQHVTLKNTIIGKIKANQSDFDVVKKSLIQSAGVTEQGADLIINAIKVNAQGRDGGNLFKMVKEAVPSVDLSLQKNLMNLIVSTRENFSARQKELIQLKVTDDNLLDKFPSSIVLAVLGQQKIEIPIVTSTAVQQAFATGKDDDTQLFQKK